MDAGQWRRRQTAEARTLPEYVSVDPPRDMKGTYVAAGPKLADVP